VLNEGATTSDRLVSVQIHDLDPKAVAMRIRINGTNFDGLEPREIESVFSETLPNWIGRNYVNVQFEYQDGTTLWAYASIVLE